MGNSMNKEQKIKLAEAYLSKLTELMKSDFDGTNSSAIIRMTLGWCSFNKRQIIK